MKKSYNVEWQMERFGLTREEAEAKVKDILQRTGKGVSKSRKAHPENNNSNKEFWIKRGYSAEDAEIKAKEKMQMMRDSYKNALEENPEKYVATSNTHIEFYLAKGMTQKEAETALKERQATFTLEKCIKKYGEEGTKRWKERNKNWSKKIEEKYKAGEFSKMSKTETSTCYSNA